MPRKAEILTGKAEKPEGEFGPDPTSNTIKLRKKYTEFVLDKQSAGEPTQSFQEWVKEMYPDVPILKPS